MSIDKRIEALERAVFGNKTAYVCKKGFLVVSDEICGWEINKGEVFTALNLSDGKICLTEKRSGRKLRFHKNDDDFDRYFEQVV